MKNLIFLFITVFTVQLANAQTTYNHIAPALFRNCTSCHHVGGGAPFSMTSYNSTAPWASAMKTALQSNEMPPWAPDTNYMHFVDERAITKADKDTILAWINDGFPEGNPSLAPTPPVYPQHLLNGTPDAIISMTPFSSNANTSDAYNTFVIPTNVALGRVIRAIEIVPGNPELIHHSIIKADSAGKVLPNTTGNAFNILGDIAIGTWAPGSLPIVFPNSPQLKMGIELPPNADIIMQIHTPKGTFGQSIECDIRLYFYPLSATGIRPVYDFVPLQYWGNDFWIGDGQVKSFSTEANMISSDISIFSAFPHSHQICTEILNYAYAPAPASPDTIKLVKIDNWDFEHQQYYNYKNLVQIPSNYKFHSDHTFDNTSSNHHRPLPPQLISVGTASNDEMLFDGFQFITYQAGDELINVDSILTNDPLLNLVSINEIKQGKEANSYVYPNPVTAKSFIYFTAPHQNWKTYHLKVFTIKGKVVNMNAKMKNGYFEINKGNLSPNLYFYQIFDGNKKVSTGKIVIQ